MHQEGFRGSTSLNILQDDTEKSIISDNLLKTTSGSFILGQKSCECCKNIAAQTLSCLWAEVDIQKMQKLSKTLRIPVEKIRLSY